MSASETQRPNFVFLLIDDMGWKDTAYQGSRFYQTPHIDRLASEGVHFTNAYAACPVCSPTRASILTGRYPATLNLTDYIPGRARPWAKLAVPRFNQWLPTSEFTIARALKQAGYATACIGKWHLGRHDYAAENEAYGFDRVVARAENDEDKMAGGLTAEACRFIEANRRRPFLLYFAHYAVHLPIQAKAELVEKYTRRIEPGDDQCNANYAGMIDSLDRSIGVLLGRLDELGLADRTMVLFMSDNGALEVKNGRRITSNAPLRAGKGTLYEGGLREPMIVRLPGLAEPGSVCDEPVSSIDFFPTMLEAAEAKVDLPNPIDGVSLMPLLQGAARLDRPRSLFWHYPHYHDEKPSSSVRDGDWKLIEFYEDGRLELYNLADDLGEASDLAEKTPTRTVALQKKLGGWRKTVGAKLPGPNPKYDPALADSDPRTQEELAAWRESVGAQPRTPR